MNIKRTVESFLAQVVVLVWLGLAIWIRSTNPAASTPVVAASGSQPATAAVVISAQR